MCVCVYVFVCVCERVQEGTSGRFAAAALRQWVFVVGEYTLYVVAVVYIYIYIYGDTIRALVSAGKTQAHGVQRYKTMTEN